MEFKYPLILIAGIIIIATLFLVSFFYKKKAKEKYVEGKRKIANTKYMKSLPYYKKIKRIIPQYEDHSNNTTSCNRR